MKGFDPFIRFLDAGGECLQGSEVPLEQPWRGIAKLIKMVSPVVMPHLPCHLLPGYP